MTKYIVPKEGLLNMITVESLVDLWKDGTFVEYDINDGRIVAVGVEG